METYGAFLEVLSLFLHVNNFRTHISNMSEFFDIPESALCFEQKDAKLEPYSDMVSSDTFKRNIFIQD